MLKARGLMPSTSWCDFYIAAEDPVSDVEVVRLATSLRQLGASWSTRSAGGARKAAQGAWSAEAKYIIEVGPC